MKYKDIVYLILDELKLTNDDSVINENHIVLLVSKYRNMILKQRYSDIKKPIPESNYQTICLTLEKINNIEGMPCTGTMLRSIEKIPNLMKIGIQRVYPQSYYLGDITYISRDRMKYVGYKPSLQSIIYDSLGPDNHIYLKSANYQYLNLKKVSFTGIFDQAEEAAMMKCTSQGTPNCDILDMDFPLEAALVPDVISLVVKEILGAEYRPEDLQNDNQDNLSDIASYIRRNMKSNFAKQLEE